MLCCMSAIPNNPDLAIKCDLLKFILNDCEYLFGSATAGTSANQRERNRSIISLPGDLFCFIKALGIDDRVARDGSIPIGRSLVPVCEISRAPPWKPPWSTVLSATDSNYLPQAVMISLVGFSNPICSNMNRFTSVSSR